MKLTKKLSLWCTPILLAATIAPSIGNAEVVTPKTVDFGFTGAVQEWTAPQSGTYNLEVWGAQGGGRANCNNQYLDIGNSGLGGYSQGQVSLNAGETLYIYVGGEGSCTGNGIAQGGWNGGGNGHASDNVEPGGGGGGATDIRKITGSWDDYTSLSSRIIVAGGGGGGGEDYGDSYGDGGGTEGSNGWFAGTQTYAGANGGFGYGGSTVFGDGGGGGGGWYGGGTEQSGNVGWDTQGGGGGSGYIGGVLNGSMQTGVNTYNGLARITLVSDQVPSLSKITVEPRSVNLGLGSATYLYVYAHY